MDDPRGHADPGVAGEILRSFTYQEAVQKAEERLVQAWKNTPPEATQVRELLWAERRALDRITRELRGIRDRAEPKE